MKIVLNYDPNYIGYASSKNAISRADMFITRLVSYRDTKYQSYKQVFTWSHELTILRICQAVRSGVIRTDEIEIHAENGYKIDVDIKGQFIQAWPTDLFELSFHCQFTNYGEVNYDSDKSTFPSEKMTPKEILKEVVSRTYNFVYKADLSPSERRTAELLEREGVLEIEEFEDEDEDSVSEKMYTINKKYFEE